MSYPVIPSEISEIERYFMQNETTDETIQMKKILNELTVVFEDTDFFVFATNNILSDMSRLPDRHDCPNSIYLFISSIELKKVCSATVVYKIDPNLDVFVYNTHVLRNDTFVRVREFKYMTAEGILEDMQSAQRSLLNLPV